jgi:hypothetical protein
MQQGDPLGEVPGQPVGVSRDDRADFACSAVCDQLLKRGPLKRGPAHPRVGVDRGHAQG